MVLRSEVGRLSRAGGEERRHVVSLASRNLKNITRQFPGVVQALARRARDDRRPRRRDRRARRRRASVVSGAASRQPRRRVDRLLRLRSPAPERPRPRRALPLDERRAALRERWSPAPACCCPIRCLERPHRSPTAVRRLGLEGVVAKRRRSTYAAGRRSDAWVKVRFARRQELVIGGFKPNADTFDSLVVGYYDGTKLMSAGKVRSGFTPHAARTSCSRGWRRCRRPRCPFANLPTARASHWGEGSPPRRWKRCAG